MENERYSSYDRKLKMYLAPSIILAIIFAFVIYKATKDSVVTSLITTCFITSVFLVIFLCCDVMLRLCQTLILLVDQQSRESFSSAMSYIFHLNTASIGVVVISVIIFLGLIIIVGENPLNYIWQFGPHINIPLMIFSFCLLRMTNLAKWESSSLTAMKGLDYGTGMAYSFYYGYLRLVLPSTGTRDSKSINEKIENFEDNHNVTFPVHKLFILIPSSGYIPPDLKEASQWMESASELEEETRNRAGNIGRKYRNNVYKLYPGGLKAGVKPQYVVAEGASPLLTYHEVLQHNHPESELFKRYKTEIIQIFHEKLKNILQSNPDTRDLCELIYYNDYDSNGVKVNVGKIILERISKLQSSI